MKTFHTYFPLDDERGVLRLSIVATVVIAFFGVVFGLLSGSFSIMFDGVYSLVDATMTILSLFVAGLIRSYAVIGSSGRPPRLAERFSMGLWHLEPMVLALNGILLMSVSGYALINAVSSILEGGRELEFDIAIVYAAATLAVCIAVAIIATRANRRIGSEFVKLDARAWLMSGGITSALLIAFILGTLVHGTDHEWLTPYIDPAVLAIVCLVIIPMPVSTVRQAFADILLITPADLKARVDSIARDIVAKYGFLTHRAYVARIGRARQVELYFIVAADAPATPIGHWDAIRDEVGEAIGDEGPDRWLTIVFTGDRAWAE